MEDSGVWSLNADKCLEMTVSSYVLSELCGHLDAGWGTCLPLLRLKGGRATLETGKFKYIITELDEIYP